MDYWQNFEISGYFHIYNKAVSGIKLYRDDDDYELFLSKFDEYLGGCFKIYAYCLMSNHFHFLVRVRQLDEILELAAKQNTVKSQALLKDQQSVNDFIIDQFKRFLSSYTLSYKNKYNHSGSVLMKRFKRIQGDGLVKSTYWLAYIHHNPIHHHYCKEYGEWKYCSYNAFLTSQNTKICRDEVVKDWFGDLEAFLKYHNEIKIELDPFESLE